MPRRGQVAPIAFAVFAHSRPRAGGSCVEGDSFASWFVMRGGSLHALLGHRDIKLTLRYAHLAPGHRRDEIDKTAAPISAPVSTKSAQPVRIDIAPPASV